MWMRSCRNSMRFSQPSAGERCAGQVQRQTIPNRLFLADFPHLYTLHVTQALALRRNHPQFRVSTVEVKPSDH
jgi:hypothetical protein